MDALKALGWVLTHLGRGRRKFPNVDSTSNAIARISARFELAKQASGAGGGPENLALLGKTLLQTAGLCVRAVVDLDLDHMAMIPLPDGELGRDPYAIGFRDPQSPVEVTSFLDNPRASSHLPDWARGPGLHRSIATGALLPAQTQPGPQSAEAVSDN
ncbi:hypothetical protein LCGC14_1041530 [marine sediment metagenome]|uniref:Uncharacterized protein n=1 Tax=marine sediment metagenome TaxID=412755 RepID=A0A0F9MRG5_9ZZZZ